MRSIHRAYSRALITTATTGAAMSIALLSGAGPAWAHVHVDADDAAPGSTSVLTFRVPGESEKGALTTEFTVALPNVASARTEVMPGWTAKLDRDAAAGTVRSVTWTAAPSVGISPDQFALFNVSVTLPNQPSVTLPATQTYSDGTVVRWDQPPLANGDEPEYPAPVLNLTGATGPSSDEHQPPPAASPTASSAEPAAAAPAVAAAPDNTARWLAGGALVLAAVGAVAAFAGRRRT
ncbi:MAG TPA: YcnI family protein [Mycobacterium sp.]|nr:YcnI family protein [Mycobacterium sp.]